MIDATITAAPVNEYSSIKLQICKLKIVKAMRSTMRSTQNCKAQYVILQCELCLSTGKLRIVLHKIAIVLHYTILYYIPFLAPITNNIEKCNDI